MIQPLWTVDDLAAYLGSPKSWVYDNAHEIPHVRVGREYRFRQAEVDLWLEASRGGCPLSLLAA
ncbi:helix-turn-helix domain-containing protein [Nonomuraea lactucae]|uniref:helix-turn-helix domain-containing protein n=1 Tax=Nonomuraea lactucae TaxID=2249762 RepID=UPI0013B40C45